MALNFDIDLNLKTSLIFGTSFQNPTMHNKGQVIKGVTLTLRNET